jgi:hypothetical protein
VKYGRARLARVLAFAIAGAALPSCAEVERRTTSSPDEYAAYRRFRVAGTVERKLATSYDYLNRHPQGAWRDEIEKWFSLAEPAYVKVAWDDASRLRLFLKVVPDGADSGKAVERLVELEMTEEYRARGERAFEAHANELEQRLAIAETNRRAFVSGVGGWVRRIAGIRRWGGRTSELDSDFIFAYRLTEPAARCDEDGCIKTVSQPYDIPEGKTQSSRVAVYDVGLRLDHGGVQGAWITGPDLFTRLGEAVRVAAVPETDLVARAEAIGQATQLIALSVERVLPAARCSAEAVSPVVLHRACDGVDLQVVSAVNLGEEDRVIVEPVASPAPATAAPDKPAPPDKPALSAAPSGAP